MIGYQGGMNPDDFVVLESMPATETRWTVWARFGSSGLNWTLQIRAVCASVES